MKILALSNHNGFWKFIQRNDLLVIVRNYICIALTSFGQYRRPIFFYDRTL